MRMQPRTLQLDKLVDYDVLVHVSDQKLYREHLIADMKREMARAVIEQGAVLFEHRRIDLPAAPTQLSLIVNLVPAQDTYHFESRVRRHIGPWLVKLLRQAGHRLFLAASWLDRQAWAR